jgi:hypothetical protein
MKKGYIYASLSILATSLFLYLILRKKEYKSILNTVDKDSVILPAFTSNTKSNYDGLIVSTPTSKLLFDTPTDKIAYNLLIVFGGVSYATPSWMYNQVNSSVLLSNLIFFAPYTMKYSDVEIKIKKFLKEKEYKIISKSVVGFSAGALNIQEVYSPDFKFFGLIDPSTRSNYTTKKYGKNTFMIYNEGNWGGFPTIKSLLPILSNKINSDGGQSLRVTGMKHEDIPKFFFTAFTNQIN